MFAKLLIPSEIYIESSIEPSFIKLIVINHLKKFKYLYCCPLMRKPKMWHKFNKFVNNHRQKFGKLLKSTWKVNETREALTNTFLFTSKCAGLKVAEFSQFC